MNRDTKVGFGILFTFIVLAGLFVFTACDGPQKDAEEEAREDVKQLAERLYSEVGTPEIQNFQEYKFAKQIQELRDKEVTTYTYYIDRQGRKHFVCESVGYGLPYSTQTTSPSKPAWDRHGNFALPQREPNGLYMPENVSATWVLCSDGDGGVRPYYSEPNLIVTPVRLERNVVE